MTKTELQLFKEWGIDRMGLDLNEVLKDLSKTKRFDQIKKHIVKRHL